MLTSRHLTLLAVLFCVTSVWSQTNVIWLGTTSTDFTATSNWSVSGNITITNDTTSTVAEFSGAATTNQPVVGANFSVAGLQFDATAGAYTVSGSGTLTIGSSGISNQGSTLQTITAPLAFGAPASIINTGVLQISGPVAINGTNTVTFGGSGSSTTVAGAITGATGAVVMSGTGTLILTGNNSYGGGTTLNSGVLRIGNFGTSGTLPGNIVDNSNLQFARSDAVTYGGVISGTTAGVVTFSGGNVTLTGASTYGGATYQSMNGILNIGTPNALPTGTALYTGNATVLNVQNSQAIALISSTLGVGNVAISAGSTFSVGSGTFGGAISGGGALTKTSSGTLVLTGANSYTGNTTVDDGQLQIGSGGTTGSVTGDIANNATLVFLRSDPISYAGVISGSGNVQQSGSGSLTLTGTSTFTGTMSINSGAVTIGDGGTNGALTATSGIIDNAQLYFNRSDSVAYGNISGTGFVNQLGSGKLTLNGTNSYSGGTFINGGTVADAAADSLSPNSNVHLNGGTLAVGFNETVAGIADVTGNATVPGAVTIAGNATLGITGSGGNDYSGTISGNGSLELANGSYVVLMGNVTHTGGTTIDAGGALKIGNGTTGVVAGTIVDNGQLYFGRSDTVTYGNITGTGFIQQQGNGTLILSGTNSFSGSTFIKAGTVTDAAAGAFSPSSQVQMQGGALDVQFNESIGGLGDFTFGNVTIPGGVTIGSSANLRITDGGGNSFSGTVGGAGALEIASGATQTLVGEASHGGGTTIDNGGTLTIGNGGTTGAVTGTIVNNGQLTFDRSDAISYANIAGTGFISQIGNGTLTLNGSNSYGNMQVTWGGLADGNAGAFAANSNISLYSAVLAVGHNETIAGLSDNSSAPGNAAIAGGATLTLTGSGTFSGNITGGGSLVLGNSTGMNMTVAGNVALGGTTTIAPNAMLMIGSDSAATTGAITGSIVDNGYLAFHRDGAMTYSGISGTGKVTVYGNGTLTLAGSNTYSGGTQVSGGGLADANDNALPAGALWMYGGNATFNHNETITTLGGGAGNVSIASGTALTITPSNSTGGGVFSGNITGGGAVAISGTNMNGQTFAGANTYSGGTTINSGALIAQNTSGSATGTGDITIANGAMLRLGNFGPGGMVSGNITANGNIQYSSTDTQTYGGVISGTGSLIVGTFGSSASSSSLTLTGANTYGGRTIVGGGTIVVGAPNTLPIATGLSLGADSLLDVQNSQTVGQFAGPLISSASIAISPGKTFTVAPASGVFGGVFEGTITGSGTFALAGASGTGVSLIGQSTYSGGTTVSGGTLYLGSSSIGSGSTITSGPIGSGSLTLAAGTGLATSSYATSQVDIANNFNADTNVTFNDTRPADGLMLAGTGTVSSSAATWHIGNYVIFGGPIKAASGTTALTFDSGPSGFGHAVLLGTADPSVTSITASTAGVIFGSQGAVPTGATLQSSMGYFGVGAAAGYTPPTAASVLALIPTANRSTFAGVLGFDTLQTNTAAHVFSDPIDLTGFGSGLTLGSSTAGIITGTITPGSSGYMFGNGGGFLIVQSPLTGANTVTVSSSSAIPGNFLTAIFEGPNTFTNNMSVTNSVAVLDSATALPAGTKVSLGANGYIGYTEAYAGATSLANFIANRLVPGAYTSSSVLGLDSHDWINSGITTSFTSGMRVDGETIDLSGLGPIYLGSASNVILTGVIKAPNQAGANQTLSLLAAGDGMLSVAAPLSANNVSNLVVGSAAPYASGTVALDSLSMFSGGVKLLNGTLAVGLNSIPSAAGVLAGPLGTGTLTVPSTAIKPTLIATGFEAEIDNAIALGTNLRLGVPSRLSTADALTAGFFGTTGLVLNGVIGDSGSPGSLTIQSDTTLNGANTFSGGVTLQSGSLLLGTNTALGTGTLTIAPDPTAFNIAQIGAVNGRRTINNNVVYNGSSNQILTVNGTGLTLAGSLTVNNNVFLSVTGSALKLNGQVTGNGRVFVQNGTVVVNPSGSTVNTFNAGLEALYGQIILASANALGSSTNLIADSGGYIGAAYVPGNLQNDFLNRFNGSLTSGTIGFDSASTSSPNLFNSPIDLRDFSSAVQLGSASSAILGTAAIITPESSTYNFGGGGGTLEVRSSLVDDTSTTTTTPRNLNVESTSTDQLLLKLTGTNNFSGGTNVSTAGVTFAAGALPMSGSISVGDGGYAGTSDPAFATNPNSFINRFTITSNHGIIGFDSLTVTGNITLSGFTSSTDPSLYLGTATNATIDGPITLPGSQSAYRFAGFNGGQLTVNTILTDGTTARSVQIGDVTSAAVAGSIVDSTLPLSGVTLAGANTYTGGTVLNSGVLYVASDAALGSGNVTINYDSFSPNGAHVGLVASGGDRTLLNPMSFVTSSALDLGGNNALTLQGAISGAGTLFKVGTGMLTLSGNNSAFTGGINILNGGVTFSSGNSVGTGSVLLGSSGTSATFLDSSVVYGIAGDSSADTINLTAGKTLVLHQNFDAQFNGTIAGATAGLSIDGTGNILRLSGASTFTGPVTIGNGVGVLASNVAALGASSNSVTVSGGKLGVDTGITVVNPITLTSGALVGLGTFKAPSPVGVFDIKTGATLTPGLGTPGTLAFDGSLLATSVLLLDSGGTYNWKVMDVANSSGGWSKIVVNGSVTISATTAAPFKLDLLSINPDGSAGPAANFDPTQSYSWTILTANSIMGLTDPNQISIVNNFMNPNSGTFTVGLNSADNALLLNFSPIPEPSTYALILAGIGAMLFVRRRRRR